MKSIIRYVAGSAAVVAVAALFQSCAMDAPFGAIGEGDLTLNTEIRSDVKVTRALDDDQLAALREKCVVYIENDKGVIRKYKGVDNIPSNIKLKCGSYIAEAWSGDSVSASFSQKFYRGYQAFNIEEGNNTLTLKCNIANVIVSVDPASDEVGLSEMQVKFSHSRGELTFDDTNITEKGYFMMPNADKNLNYEITGKKDDGTSYSKSGVIENVQRAHEYQLLLTKNNSVVTEGGAMIQIVIKDIPVIDEVAEIFPAPSVKGLDFDIAQQVVKGASGFNDIRVFLCGYFGMNSVLLDFGSGVSGLPENANILNESVASQLAAKGINVEVRKSQDAAETTEDGKVEVDEVYVTFTKAFLDALPASDTEYKFTFEATDGRHRVNSGSLRLANTEAAIERQAPVGTVDAPNAETEPMAVLATEATLSGQIYDSSATGFGIKYREVGTSAWTEAYPTGQEQARARRNARGLKPMTKAAPVSFKVKISGLKAGTTYEYKSFCDGFDNGAVSTFTTESVYAIPYSSFEEWNTHKVKTILGVKDVWFAGSEASPTFWDSGNAGAATANIVLTNKSTDMVHSGTYCAKLESKSAAGKLAAGNIFAGDYVKTDGTDGVLSLGRPYNGSHPAKLRVWANYRPGKVNIMVSSNASKVDFNEGDNDHGQIYIALTDEPIEIRTKSSDQKLFDPNDVHVLAYNQVTWKDAFGEDGQLKQIDIPFVYNDRAQTKRPTHIVIVCCASKFGDFFSGSSSSVLYLDDFQLIYE